MIRCSWLKNSSGSTRGRPRSTGRHVEGLWVSRWGEAVLVFIAPAPFAWYHRADAVPAGWQPQGRKLQDFLHPLQAPLETLRTQKGPLELPRFWVCSTAASAPWRNIHIATHLSQHLWLATKFITATCCTCMPAFVNICTITPTRPNLPNSMLNSLLSRALVAVLVSLAGSRQPSQSPKRSNPRQCSDEH